MGLAERRRISQIQTENVPGFLRRIQTATDKEITAEFDWASFEADASSLGCIMPMACDKVEQALKAICRDAVGKEAIAGGLRHVVFRNLAEPAGNRIELADGVLTIEWAWGKSGSKANLSGEIVQRAIEASL